MPRTEFKLNLMKGCSELNIGFSHESIKDITIDVIVQELLEKFNTFLEPLNSILRK